MKINDAVILVGGKGSRLGSLTLHTPKPLIKINNIPFIDYLISKLIKLNFKKIYLLCSYKKKLFFKLYNNKVIHNTKLICINEGKPRGTGGALYKLKKKINKPFFLINGDTFFDINFNYLINVFKKNKLGIIALTNIKNSINNKLMINLDLDSKSNVLISNKKTKLMNGGIYLLNNKIFKFIKNKNFSLENDIFPILINKKLISGVYFKNKFVDIGSIKKLSYLKKNNKMLLNKAFFLDRDGVINKENGYVTKYSKFIFNKGVGKAIKYLNDLNYLVIIITNQSAIGRKFMNEHNLKIIHNKMKNNLSNRYGAKIDDIFYAPYYKYSKIALYRKNKNDRKPNIGLFIKAIKKWNIDINKSFFIGDKQSDKLAAEKAGVKFYFKNDISFNNQLKKIIKFR